MNNISKTISILGCGWYGIELAKKLVKAGYHVKGSCTTIQKIQLLKANNIHPYLVNFQEKEENFDPEFFNTDILFICIPPKRNTGEQSGFSKKIERIHNAAESRNVKNIVFISSTAVYSDSNTELTELDQPLPVTPSGKAILEAEQMLQSKNKRCTILRFSGLVGPGRDPGRFFAGKTNIPNGLAPINLIHLEDCIGISIQIIEKQAFGYIFNACCPDHPAKQEFYTKAAKRTNLELPEFINELSTWKTIGSKNINSILKYKYLVTKWAHWLEQDKL